MTKSLMIRDLPTSLQRDGWWLNAAPPRGTDHRSDAADAHLQSVLGLLLLVVLADLLFWNHIRASDRVTIVVAVHFGNLE